MLQQEFVLSSRTCLLGIQINLEDSQSRYLARSLGMSRKTRNEKTKEKEKKKVHVGFDLFYGTV